MGKFQELKVWQKSVDLAVYVYAICEKDPLCRNYGLKDQIQRSAISIASNIAEGDELGTQKQAIKHFNYSKGSSAELLTQSVIAKRTKMMTLENGDHIISECLQISKMINSLIKYRNKYSN